jgi:hypothetical protein
MENILNRIDQIAQHEGISITALEQRIGASKGVLSRALKKDTDIQSKWLVRICETFPRYNAAWIISGQEDMLRGDNIRKANRIPFYKDVDEVRAVEEQENEYNLSYIDPGDWFPGATAATLYYNTSMKEYAPGCLLVLRQKHKIDELIWGEHYIIEYGDNRLLREIQPSEDKDFIYAYATNEATYLDGRYKYPPVKISKKDIHSIFQVLGYVCKRQDNGAIYSTDLKP